MNFETVIPARISVASALALVLALPAYAQEEPTEFTFPDPDVFVEGDNNFLPGTLTVIENNNGDARLFVGVDQKDGTLFASPQESTNQLDPNLFIRGGGSDGSGFLTIGSDGATGVIEQFQSGIFIEGLNAFLQVGSGGNGNLEIGNVLDEDGSTIGNRSSLTLDARETATASFGAFDGVNSGFGSALIANGDLRIQGDNGAILSVGGPVANGDLVILEDGGVDLRGGAGEALIFIGDGRESDGSITVNGGNLSAGNDDNSSQIYIATPLGLSAAGTSPGDLGENDKPPSGALNIDNNGFVFANTVVVGGSSEAAGLPVGGSGSLTVTTGGTLRTNDLFIGGVGDTGQSDGTVTVRSGGRILMTDAPDQIEIGDNGTLDISGEGSGVVVGSSVKVGGTTGSGPSFVRVDDGGLLNILGGDLYLGDGAILSGNGGTIQADQVVLDGGTIAPGNSPGSLLIDAGVSILSGFLNIEIAGTEAGQFDFIEFTQELFGVENLILDFRIADGVDLSKTGLEFLKLSGGGDVMLSDATLHVNGQAPASGLSLFSSNGSFGFGGVDPFTTDEGPDVSGVPLPAGLPLLLAGLGGFAVLRRTRNFQASN